MKYSIRWENKNFDDEMGTLNQPEWRGHVYFLEQHEMKPPSDGYAELKSFLRFKSR